MNLQNVTDITDGELGWDKSKVSILGVKSLLTAFSKAFPGLWKTDLSCPEIDLYFCYVSHKMTSPFCWLIIDLRQFTKIICFYDVWIFAPWIWSCWVNRSKCLRAAQKSPGVAEKNKEKNEANCTGFSAVLGFSVCRNVLFWIWNNFCKNY